LEDKILKNSVGVLTNRVKKVYGFKREVNNVMSILTIVMIFSFVIIFVVIGLTIIVTNKAYEVLPESNKVDPLPIETEQDKNEKK